MHLLKLFVRDNLIQEFFLLFILQMLAPIIRLVTNRACPMTDNACVSLYAVGTGAAAAAQITRSRKGQHINSSDMLDSAEGPAAHDDTLLLAITEDQFGNYLVNPETLETLKQVHVLLSQLSQPQCLATACLGCFVPTYASSFL